MIDPILRAREMPDWIIAEAINKKMSRHMDFVGQRADKAVVVGFGEVYDGIVAKEVDHYTMSCDECDGDGYYDQRGDVICEGCGMMLNHRPSTINTEFTDGDTDKMGASRGLEKMDETEVGHTPSTS